jgi:alginate O-acetyltransferase complex protein AlgI
MLFPTLNFLIFFIIVFAVSWSLIDRMAWRKYFLIAASYVFYGYWDWRFTGLLFASTVINYVAARVVAASDRVATRKWAVGIAVLLDLGILGFFKYYGFFLESLDNVLHQVGWQRDLPFLEIILPVGISFFTFQGISYVIDVYREKIEVRRDLADVMLYISFFPQLVAGPIVRASDFIPQLDRRPDPNRVLVGMGLLLIVWGLFKKQILASYIAIDLADKAFFDPARYGAVDLLLGVWGYAVQIYCDFSAYSDIAIGVAALLGYTFPRNFDQPYRAVSLSDFWRRWHISLSSWLRDYLYIPLGGNRKGRVRTYVNLMITMLLGGLWHGAAWKFIVWGALHGGGLGVERALGGAGRVVGWTRSHALSVFLVFNFVCLAWIFFRARTMGDAATYIAGFANWSAPVELVTPLNLILVAFGLTIHFAPRETLGYAEGVFSARPLIVRALFCALFVTVTDAFGLDDAAPFIYFQF